MTGMQCFVKEATLSISISPFLQRYAAQSAVLTMIDYVCPSVCLSTTVWYHAKMTQATIMRSSLEDRPMTLVLSVTLAQYDRPKGP